MAGMTLDGLRLEGAPLPYALAYTPLCQLSALSLVSLEVSFNIL